MCWFYQGCVLQVKIGYYISYYVLFRSADFWLQWLSSSQVCYLFRPVHWVTFILFCKFSWKTCIWYLQLFDMVLLKIRYMCKVISIIYQQDLLWFWYMNMQIIRLSFCSFEIKLVKLGFGVLYTSSFYPVYWLILRRLLGYILIQSCTECSSFHPVACIICFMSFSMVSLQIYCGGLIAS